MSTIGYVRPCKTTSITSAGVASITNLTLPFHLMFTVFDNVRAMPLLKPLMAEP